MNLVAGGSLYDGTSAIFALFEWLLFCEFDPTTPCKMSVPQISGALLDEPAIILSSRGGITVRADFLQGAVNRLGQLRIQIVLGRVRKVRKHLLATTLRHFQDGCFRKIVFTNPICDLVDGFLPSIFPCL